MKEDTNVNVIVGKLVRDAEIKKTCNLTVGFFTIAVNRKKKEASGNYTEEASFFDVNVYEKYAEVIIDRLKKGVQVSIVGSLKQERWIDKNTGENKSRVVITANSIQILGGQI